MRKKLLLADDSITIQKVVELTFPSDEFEVVTAGNGRLAVDKAATFMPDVVLCDVIMPQMDGYQVCEALRAMPALGNVPILLLNGAFEPYDPERAKAAGALGNVSKPFDPPALVAKVKEILASRPAPALAPPVETVPVPPDEQGPSAFSWDESEEATAISTMDVPSDVRESAARSMALDAPVFAESPMEAEIPSAETPDLGAPVTNLSATLHDSLEALEPIGVESAEPPMPEAEAGFDSIETTTGEVSLGASYEAGFMGESGAEEASMPGMEAPSVDGLDLAPEAEEPGLPKTLPPMSSPFAASSAPSAAPEGEQEFEPQAFEAVASAPEPEIEPMQAPVAAEVPMAPELGAADDVAAASAEASWSSPADETLSATAPDAPVVAPGAAAEVAVPVDMVQQIAQRVISQVSERVIREIAWDVIPALAEKLIQAEIERIKARAETERD